DALVVHAGATAEAADIQMVERDISRAMRLVDAIGDPMRRRGRGDIVLVSPLAGRATTGDAGIAMCITEAFLAYGTDLRERLHAAGVSVAVVVPSRLGIRAAARLREPLLSTVVADRLVEQIARGLRRRRAVIEIGRAHV